MKRNIMEENLSVIMASDEEDEEESECISQLLQADCDVNEGPAFKAVRNNDIPFLTAIIFTGYDINYSNENEDCPSKNAFYEFRDWSRMARVVRLKGYTPLHLAVVHSTMKTIKYLLSKGADVNVTDANLMSPLSLAAAVQRADVTKLLIRTCANVDSQSVSGRTPLIQAIGNNNLRIVRQLLKAGADPNLADLKGTTPLFMNVQARRENMDNLKVMQALIDAGSTVDLPNKQGATALMLAVGTGRLDAADVLLKAGADINVKDKTGQTLMHLVTSSTIALYLLHHGASTNSPDKKGITPLYRAASVASLSLINLFLESDVPRNLAILDLPRMIQARQQYQLFDTWLQHQLGSPRTLRRLCRQVIRQSMSPSNTSHISSLPVPQMIQDFLLCKHVELTFSRTRPQLIPSTVPTLHP